MMDKPLTVKGQWNYSIFGEAMPMPHPTPMATLTLPPLLPIPRNIYMPSHTVIPALVNLYILQNRKEGGAIILSRTKGRENLITDIRIINHRTSNLRPM